MGKTFVPSTNHDALICLERRERRATFLDCLAMKPPIPLSSPLYLRRLVRALNAEAATGNGFYAGTPDGACRCGRACRCGECVEVRPIGGSWFATEGLSFWDSNGRDIVASRR